MAHRLVTSPPFAPAFRLAGRPGAELAALAALIEADPDDLESLLVVLAVTDRLARDAAAAFIALPPTTRYHGPGAAAVMMPFLHPHTSRFSSGRYGVLYGAESTETAAAEVSHHHAHRLRAVRAPGGATVVLALWAFTVNTEVADLRGHAAAIYNPEDYRAAQSLGQRLRHQGAVGIRYRSVRRAPGECLGIFVPRVVDNMEKRDDWRLVWNGKAISEILRVA
jgi:hypothetical protein